MERTRNRLYSDSIFIENICKVNLMWQINIQLKFSLKIQKKYYKVKKDLILFFSSSLFVTSENKLWRSSNTSDSHLRNKSFWQGKCCKDNIEGCCHLKLKENQSLKKF